MPKARIPDCDITVVVRVRDDEDRIGHVLRRVVFYLRAQKLSFEVLVADEGSGDNTLAVAALLRPTMPELEVMHAAPNEGFFNACQRARGRVVMLHDARIEAPIAPLGFALRRLDEGLDVVALGGRYLVFRRTRTWRVLPTLVAGGRGLDAIEPRFLKRARALGLACTVTHPKRSVIHFVPTQLRQALRLG